MSKKKEEKIEEAVEIAPEAVAKEESSDLSKLSDEKLKKIAPPANKKPETKAEYAALVEIYRRENPVKFAEKQKAGHFEKVLATLK